MNTDEIYQFIKEHFDDEGGNWENAWTPFITDELTELTMDETKVFETNIWNWEDKFIYKIADPILWCENKYMDSNQLYCKIFSHLSDLWQLSYLAENLRVNLHDIKTWNSNLLLDIKTNLSSVIAYISNRRELNHNLTQCQEILILLDAELNTRNT
jgi:hypothetical protein